MGSYPPESFIDLGLNKETRLEFIQGLIVPNSRFFIRNHGATPIIDPKAYRLKIEGSAITRPLELTLDDLLRMPSRSVLSYVECAGNGRSFFRDFLGRPAEGGQWRLGAIGVAEWTGVPLAEVLERAGVQANAVDVLLEGLDGPKVNRPIPIEKALDSNTILAYSMNGEAIPPDHGFPVRALTPGWVGINNIKWIGRIQVENRRILVTTNTTTYILDGPDYPEKPPVTLQSMKSAIALPWPAALPVGARTIRGFAWSPRGKIAKVEYSLDGGKTWALATLHEPNQLYAWVRWSFPWEAKPGSYTITTRATDEKWNTQPDKILWNRLGYLYNAVVGHPVKVV